MHVEQIPHRQEEEEERVLSTQEEMRRLRHFNDVPVKFWPELLDVLGRVFEAQAALLMVHPKERPWQQIGRWPKQKSPLETQGVEESVLELVGQAGAEELAEGWLAIPGSDRSQPMLAGRLELPEGQPEMVLLLLLPEEASLKVLRRLFSAVSDIPQQYLTNRMINRSSNESLHIIRAIDLMVVLNDTSHFVHASMALCDELVMQLPCDRVSLGWLKGDYLHVQAISHIEKINRKMEIVQVLEGVMEEALDQDAEILYPAPALSTTISHEHGRYATANQLESVLSIPLRIQNRVVAVITCERHQGSFNQSEVLGLRILSDQAVYRLDTLQDKSRWFGLRLWDGLKKGARQLFGVENTSTKVTVLTLGALFFYLALGSWSYRVEAPFILRTDSLAFVPAPFEGYVKDVYVKVGDRVEKDGLLLNLDTTDLLMRETELFADMSRYAREEEKMRSRNALADMRIAAAMKDQMGAKLAEIRYNLARATLRASSNGVVVEGELEKMLGTPVKKGEVLFKVAELDGLYAELAAEERDVHTLRDQLPGEVSFISQPQLKFPIVVQRINPAAEVKDGINVFVIRAEFQEETPAWWRPGMSGVAKIDVGDRSPLWILTHRTVEFLRLFFWW
jgi:hypothetical protein